MTPIRWALEKGRRERKIEFRRLNTDHAPSSALQFVSLFEIRVGV